MIPYKQLSSNDIFTDYQNKFESDKPSFIRHIFLYNKDFMKVHPDIIVDRKTDSSDEDKSVHDSKFLIITLKGFSASTLSLNSKLFLEILLLILFNFTKIFYAAILLFFEAYIPLNERSRLKNPGFAINSNEILCYPKDKNLPIEPAGTAKPNARLTRFKFICPKTEWLCNPLTQKAYRHCKCCSPCTWIPNAVA